MKAWPTWCVILSLYLMFMGHASGAADQLKQPNWKQRPTPSPLPGLVYQDKLLEGPFLSEVSRPEELLGFPIGKQMASTEEIEALIKRWSQQSPRMQLHEYARSHGNRPLHYAVISSPENLLAIDDIQARIQRLAEPKGLSSREAKKLIEGLPATAWMTYSIHGNETSGSDAALALIYQLTASKSPEVEKLLKDTIVFIDPVANPDGRARFHKRITEHRGISPNVDAQALIHSDSWPYGRTNHYMFDLNRDFLYLTQPETRGMVETINAWYPQLMIDSHEMGAMDSFLFSPPTEPINRHIRKSHARWAEVFAKDQAKAFDNKKWPYYTGEWFENLYPGYSNYVEYNGSLHILYEQARVAPDGIRKENHSIESYQESVHHQLLSSMVNLKTLQKHSKNIYMDFYQNRVANNAKKGPYAKRSFIILANDNESRIKTFTNILDTHRIRWFRTRQVMRVNRAVDHLGIEHKRWDVPANSIIVPNRQFQAPLIAAMLEFNSPISEQVLQEERRRRLRNGTSIMYDVTAWNLTMMMGLPALEVPQNFPIPNIAQKKDTTKPIVNSELGKAIEDNKEASMLALAVSGSDDASLGYAAQLLEQGIKLRVLDKETKLNDQSWPRGSVFAFYHDNKNQSNLTETILKVAQLNSVEAKMVDMGLGLGDFPDIGGRHFPLLERPQVGIFGFGSVETTSYGYTWFGIDQHLGIRHSKLEASRLARMDLSRYNVLILPHSRASAWSEFELKRLQNWVKAGGTLIALGGSAAALSQDRFKLTSTKQLAESFDKAEEMNIRLQRDRLSTRAKPKADQVWQHTVPSKFQFPWQHNLTLPKPEELRRRDMWMKNMMPSGAFVAGDTDSKHWLTIGSPNPLPILFSSGTPLMVQDRAEAVIRLGVMSEKNTSSADQKKAKEKSPLEKTPTWYMLPDDQQIHIRMSGLLWPEAAVRLANSAYLVREPMGRGQMILFADQPNFRGLARGTERLLLNAIVYGPGLGTAPDISL